MKHLAVFDFDHTLITGDSFIPFLRYAAGDVNTMAAIAEASALLALRRLRQDRVEARFFVKNHLLHRLLAGRERESLRGAAAQTRAWQKINEPVMRKLNEHHQNGDVIVIASGSLDLYLSDLLMDIPHAAVICTDIGVKNGFVTGEMVHGNCVRVRKAERVREWIKAHEPFDETFGYGNYPHDVPMLNLVKHRILVS